MLEVVAMINFDEELARMNVMIERRERMALGVTCSEMIELITRLRQAEKDAARYRWLKEIGRHEYDVGDFFDGSCDRIDIKVDGSMKCEQ